MPIHDPTRVEARLFHRPHHRTSAIGDAHTSPAQRNAGVDSARVCSMTEPYEDNYLSEASRIVIRRVLDEVGAVIELVAPGDKSGKPALRKFVGKAVDLLNQGVHHPVIDQFPPSTRIPQGIRKRTRDDVREAPFALPADKPLILVSDVAGPLMTTSIDPIVVGDAPPNAPVFLELDWQVPLPLEATYQTTQAQCPRLFQEAVAL